MMGINQCTSAKFQNFPITVKIIHRISQADPTRPSAGNIQQNLTQSNPY